MTGIIVLSIVIARASGQSSLGAVFRRHFSSPWHGVLDARLRGHDVNPCYGDAPSLSLQVDPGGEIDPLRGVGRDELAELLRRIAAGGFVSRGEHAPAPPRGPGGAAKRSAQRRALT